jgi:glycosyltransferase involved in cell wall biosynthesis
VYAAHNVEHQIGRGRAQTWPQLLTRLQAKSLLAVETAYARNADLVVTVTEEDKKWFQQLNKQVSCIPNAVHPAEYRFQSPSARAKGPVVFIGHLSYPPNLDAARELIGSIFPLLHQRLPDTHLVVAGKRPPRRLRRMTSSNVSVVGDVGDIRRIWEQAAALLSPLRNGGGSRLKLLEAAACGVPIIATGFSARGSSLQPGRDFLAVEDPAGMAAACEALLRQPGRWDGTAVQARKTIEQHHNWENLTDRLRQIYESLAHHHR